MSALPHQYVVSLSAQPETNFDANAEGLPPLLIAPPSNFGGPGDQWSPEDLLVASLSSCLILSFRAIARISKLAWSDFDCKCTGTLDKLTEGEAKNKMAFTHFDTQVTLTVNNESDVEKAEKLVHKAEANCLVSNSLNCSKSLSVNVQVSAS